MKVEVCSACWKAGAEISNEAFLAELEKLQQEMLPLGVSVERMGCQRFCPPDKVTISIDNRMTMAKEPSREAIAELIRSHLDQGKK